jgi:hypothetical protein
VRRGDARFALQSFRSCCSPRHVSVRRRPLGLGCSSRVPHLTGYRGCWFRDSTMPLAVSSAAWLFPGQAAPPTVKRSMRPLFEFGRPPEFCPTRPSRPAAANQLLSWAFVPYSTHGIGGPLTRALPTRYVPSSGFGYPLDGLRPPSPCRFYFTPAALLGFTLRSFLLSEGIHRVSAAEGPTYRFTRRFSRRRSGGPAPRAAVPGL